MRNLIERLFWRSSVVGRAKPQAGYSPWPAVNRFVLDPAPRRPTMRPSCRSPGRGWHLRPIASWSARSCFPAAISASWPSAGRSTTWRWPGPARPINQCSRSSSKRVCRSRRSAAWWPRWPSGPGGRRADRYRRHQGGRSGQGGRHFHQHGGHRLGPVRGGHLAGPSAARRCRPPERRSWPARHGDHVGSRGAAVRGRWRAIAPLSGLVEAMLDAEPESTASAI